MRWRALDSRLRGNDDVVGSNLFTICNSHGWEIKFKIKQIKIKQFKIKTTLPSRPSSPAQAGDPEARKRLQR